MCVNGSPVVALHGKEYCSLVLDPGPVTLSHEFGWGRIMNDLRLELEPGKTYYVAYRFWVNPFHEHPNPAMVLVDQETGTNEMSVCTIKSPQ